jgi:hypothetical protein
MSRPLRQAAQDPNAYFGNDDATPERLAKARAAGLKTPIVDILLHTGMPSGAKRRVIERPLDTALRRGWIDDYQKLAGDKFLQHMVGARAQIRFSVSRWEMAVDGGRSQVDSDAKSYHQNELRRSMLAIRSGMRDPFIDWMAASEQTDVSVTEFGAKFTQLMHKESQKGAGILVLQIILNDLAAHFGYISRPSSWQTRQQLEYLLRRNQSQAG